MAAPLVLSFAASIETRARSYELRRPVFVVAEQLAAEGLEGAWWVENEGLALHGYGPSLPEALRSLCESFDVQFHDLVRVPAEQLSPGALEVRHRLRTCVAAVKERS